VRAGAIVAGVLLTGLGYVRELVRRRRGLAALAPVVDTGDDHVTVVIATHNRTDSLRTCLESVLASEGVDFDVVVVDNAPASDATATMVAADFGDDPRVRLIREGRPGLGRAHNRGLDVATGDIVAFTDDDVVVDRQWLMHLVAVFRADPEVGCVTGRIAPLELATPTQRWLEAYAGYGKGTQRQCYDLGPNRPADALFPYTAGAFGSGANMAFRTSVLRSIGGFDPLLGAGTRTRGGDDLAAFFDVVTAGHRLVYEPSAVVWHRHHRTYEALRRGMFGYGAGLTAYLSKTVIDRPASSLDVIRRIPAGCRHALHPKSPKNVRTPTDFPPQLKRLERAGMIAGPLLYARSRVGGTR
jgi:GT2 family glycosyltransferase